jgi:hypothetical protein
MKPGFSSRKWSKVGGKFNQRRDSGCRWMKTQGQANTPQPRYVWRAGRAPTVRRRWRRNQVSALMIHKVAHTMMKTAGTEIACFIARAPLSNNRSRSLPGGY